MSDQVETKQQLRNRIDRGWKTSSQRKYYYLSGFFYIAALVGVGFTISWLDAANSFRTGLQLVLGFGIFILIFGAPSYHRSLKEDYADELITDNVSYGQQTPTPPNAEEQDFIARWDETQKNIRTYHRQAIFRSRLSFFISQIAAIAGLIVIGIIANIAVSTNSAAASIAASIVGVSAAGLTAYLGGTFVKMQSESTAELREYFLQPVEYARVLAAEKLLRTISDERMRNESVQIMIKSILPTQASNSDSN